MIQVDAEAIRVKMARIDMNRRELAEAAGISEMTLRLILNGGDCKLTTLGSIARALGMVADEILIVSGEVGEGEQVPA